MRTFLPFLNNYIGLVFFSVCFFSISVFSQTYVPFPTENARWKGGVTNHESYWKSYVLITDSDTLVDGFTYTKLKQKSLFYPWHNQGIPHSTPSFGEGYVGCYRNDATNKKVYFIPPDSNTESLWYDFNMNVGDTISYYGNGTKTVLNIDSVLIDGTYRTRLTIDSCDQNSEPSYFIEGIGSTFGLISTGNCPFESSEELTCVTVNGSVIYNIMPFDSNCSTINSVPNGVGNTNQISLYPNPTKEFITIQIFESVNIKYSLSIFNLLGIRVYENDNYTSGSTISVYSLKAGVYYYKLERKLSKKILSGMFLKE